MIQVYSRLLSERIASASILWRETKFEKLDLSDVRLNKQARILMTDLRPSRPPVCRKHTGVGAADSGVPLLRQCWHQLAPLWRPLGSGLSSAWPRSFKLHSIHKPSFAFRLLTEGMTRVYSAGYVDIVIFDIDFFLSPGIFVRGLPSLKVHT